MKALGAKTLKEIGDIYREFDVIGIDEGQFFPDVRLTFVTAIDRGMVRPGSQRREGRHHLCPRWHLLEDRLRVHPPTHPQGREGQETSSHLQGLQPERKLFLQNVQFSDSLDYRG